MEADNARRSARTAEAKEKGFKNFLASPLVRIGLASIPAGEHQDNLRMLLQAAFESGFGSGQGDIVIDIFETMRERENRSR